MFEFVTKAFKPKPARKRRKGPPTPEVEETVEEEAAPDEFLSLEDLESMVVESKPEPAKKARPKAKKKRKAAAKSAQPATAAPAKRPMTPERAKLIQEAMRVQREQQEVFANLSQQERDKLYVMAMKTLIDKDFGEKGK